MKITKLELETNRLAETQRFYSRQLGLPVLRSTANSVTFSIGWSELVFRQVDDVVVPCHFALNVPIYTLEQYQLWYDLPYINTSPSGQQIAHFPAWKARAAYFCDNNGNLVEFIERVDAGFADTMGFQCISEIGVAADDVAATAAYLANTCHVGQFAKSKPQLDFNAVGDDFGLFILARTGRPWLFTNIPAAQQRWRVNVCDADGRAYTLVSTSLNQLPASEWA